MVSKVLVLVEIPDKKIVFDIEHFQEIYARLEILQTYLDGGSSLDIITLKKSVNELCKLADEHAIFLKNFRNNCREIAI